MKKFIMFIAVLALMTGVCSCGNNDSDEGSKAGKNVSSGKIFSNTDSTHSDNSLVINATPKSDESSETDSLSFETSSDVSSVDDSSSEAVQGSDDEIKTELTAACETAKVQLIGKSTVPAEEGMRIFDEKPDNLDVYSFRVDFDDAARVFEILNNQTDIYINLGFADDKGKYDSFAANDWHMYWYSDLKWIGYTDEEKKRNDDHKCVYGILQMPEGKSIDDLKLFLKFGSLWGDEKATFVYDVENTEVADFDFSKDDSLDCIDGEYFLHYKQTDEADFLYASKGKYCDECKGKDIVCCECYYDYVCLSKPGKYIYTEDINSYGSDGENVENKLHIHRQSVSAQWKKSNFSTGWRIIYSVEIDRAKWDSEDGLDKKSQPYRLEMYKYLSECIEKAWFSLDGEERFNAHTGIPLHLESSFKG